MPCLRMAAFLALSALASLSTFASVDAAPSTDTAAPQQTLTAGQIDQLVAPIALYPDTLLAKVLIASTYPLEVVEADRWVKANSSQQGSALDTALAAQTWDDSVKTLVHAPVVLAMMSAKIDNTSKLGDAFLSQQDDVIASVQRLRRQAMNAGKLQSTQQQTVSQDDQNIVIAPTQTETVYVPYYTADVYGPWAWDDYPPYYWAAPLGYAYAAGFFTAAITNAAIWTAAVDWRNHHLLVDNNINFNRNINRGGFISGQTWHHDPDHRHGVHYSRPALQNQFGQGQLAGADARRDFRGFDQGGGSRDPFDRGGGGAGGRDIGDRGGFGDRTAGGAFDGIGQGGASRGFSDRGFSSFGGRGGGFGGFRGRR